MARFLGCAPEHTKANRVGIGGLAGIGGSASARRGFLRVTVGRLLNPLFGLNQAEMRGRVGRHQRKRGGAE